MRACEFNHMCLWDHLTAPVPHTWRSQDDPGIREIWLVPSVSINPRITLHSPECHVSDQRIRKCKRCRQRPPIDVSILPLLHSTTLLLQRSINLHHWWTHSLIRSHHVHLLHYILHNNWQWISPSRILITPLPPCLRISSKKRGDSRTAGRLGRDTWLIWWVHEFTQSLATPIVTSTPLT